MCRCWRFRSHMKCETMCFHITFRCVISIAPSCLPNDGGMRHCIWISCCNEHQSRLSGRWTTSSRKKTFIFFSIPCMEENIFRLFSGGLPSFIAHNPPRRSYFWVFLFGISWHELVFRRYDKITYMLHSSFILMLSSSKTLSPFDKFEREKERPRKKKSEKNWITKERKQYSCLNIHFAYEKLFKQYNFYWSKNFDSFKFKENKMQNHWKLKLTTLVCAKQIVLIKF